MLAVSIWGYRGVGVWGSYGTCPWQRPGLLMQVQSLILLLLGRDDPALKLWDSPLTPINGVWSVWRSWDLIQACRTLLSSQGGVFHSPSYPW